MVFIAYRRESPIKGLFPHLHPEQHSGHYRKGKFPGPENVIIALKNIKDSGYFHTITLLPCYSQNDVIQENA